jgi:hypothetical protein
LTFVLSAPPLAAGLSGLGAPAALALLGACGVAGSAAWWVGRRLGELLGAVLPRNVLAAGALAIISLALLYPYGRLAIFMADHTRTACAFHTGSPTWTFHSCFTAYSEADRLALDGTRNIYDASGFEGRTIHGFRVDTYYYPPVFLLQPRAVALLTGGAFLPSRAVWYALQCLTLSAVALLLAWWLGGANGGRALLLLPLLYSAQPMLAGLQYGNIQVTAVTTSVLGILLIAKARPALGGALLGLATVSKIFPGLLGIYLLTSRRWRGAAWTAGWSVLLVIVALGAIGAKPFVDFIGYALKMLIELSWLSV